MGTCSVKSLLFFSLLILIQPFSVWGSDFDDGIAEYKDDPIAEYDELGKKDRNISYIKAETKSRARVKTRAATRRNRDLLAKGDDPGDSATSHGTGINSVLIGPGGTVQGDIIIIDESHGDKTSISE